MNDYRYTLWRVIHQPTIAWGGIIVWVMLNPSTATDIEDDPTIRKIMKFSKKFGFSQMIVVNLYALRSTDPSELWSSSDPIGPDNNEVIDTTIKMADQIVCAWGNHAMAGRVKQFLKSVGNCELKCLKLNKTGMPAHPLYLPDSTELISYD